MVKCINWLLSVWKNVGNCMYVVSFVCYNILFIKEFIIVVVVEMVFINYGNLMDCFK